MEIRLGDIPGITPEEKKGLEAAFGVLGETLKQNFTEDLKGELAAMEQRILKRVADFKTNPAEQRKQQYCLELIQALRGRDYAAARSLPGKYPELTFLTQANEIGSSAAGGVLPSETVNDVVDFFTHLPGIHKFVKRVPVGALSGKVPIFTDSDAVATVVAEFGTPGNIKPTITSDQFTLMHWAKKVVLSGIVMRYSVPAFYQALVEYVARVQANTYDKQIAVGADSNEFLGLENAEIEEITTGTTIIDRLRDVYYALPETAVPNAIWTMNRKTRGKIHAAQDGDGRYIFPQNVELTELFGHPIVTNSYHSDDLVFFGDPGTYFIYEGMALTVKEISEGWSPSSTDFVGIVVGWDADGGVAVADAWRKASLVIGGGGGGGGE
ncbi:phage major capsid protein [Thermogutta sp.]|uniref:phage major capsid protein n=1 Tax=Thermogutta sp. TaxID=1962930 RepID=UPI00321FC182